MRHAGGGGVREGGREGGWRGMDQSLDISTVVYSACETPSPSFARRFYAARRAVVARSGVCLHARDGERSCRHSTRNELIFILVDGRRVNNEQSLFIYRWNRASWRKSHFD